MAAECTHVSSNSHSLYAVTMALVLAHLFGGSYLHFNTTDDGDSCFSFTVASPAIAKLIASMGDFHKRGMPIRFPWPQLMGGAQRPLRAAVKIPSLGPVSSSSSPFAFATLPTPSSTLDLPKVRRKRPGISFFYRMLNVSCFSQPQPHVHYTHHTHPLWITFMPISVRPNELLVESALNHCFSVQQDFHAIKVHELIFKSGVSSRPVKFEILKSGSLVFDGFRLFIFDQLDLAVAHCSRFPQSYFSFFLHLAAHTP